MISPTPGRIVKRKNKVAGATRQFGTSLLREPLSALALRCASYCRDTGCVFFNALPQGAHVESAGGQKDLAAPITAVNTGETERLREEAARQMVLR